MLFTRLQWIRELTVVFAALLFILVPSWVEAQSFTGANAASSHSLDYCTITPPGTTLNKPAGASGVLDLYSTLLTGCDLWAQYYSNANHDTVQWNPQCTPNAAVSSNYAGGTYAPFYVNGTVQEIRNGTLVAQSGGIHYIASCGCTDSRNINLVGLGTDATCYCKTGYDWDGNYHACLPEKYFVSAAVLQGPQCGSTCNGVGDPVDPASGAVYSTETDVNESANALKFSRYYNSSDASTGDISSGWRHSFTRMIKPRYQSFPFHDYVSTDPNNSPLYSDPASACTTGFTYYLKRQFSNWSSVTASYANGVCSLVQSGVTIGTLPIYYASTLTPSPGNSIIAFDATRDDGQLVSFTVSGGSIVAPPGISLRLQQTGSGYLLTDNSDNVETYDSTGKLLWVASRSGVVQTLGYDTSNRLSTVTDSFGHGILLTYNSLNHLASVTDSSQLSVQYGYDAYGRLSTVMSTDGNFRTYLYENTSFPNAMTGVLDENNTRYSTWVYNSQGRATSTQDSNGANAMTLVYNSDNTVTTNDALGASRTFTFGRYGDRSLVTGVSGSQCATCSEGKATTYDLGGFLSSRTDYNGNVTKYTYDDTRGLETSRTEAYGTTAARTITTQWHSTYRLPTLISIYSGGTATGTPIRTTSFTYDTNGNQLTKTITDPATKN